jgi:hypothetical protein
VADGFGVHQRTDFAQLVDDGRVGLPDELAAEEGSDSTYTPLLCTGVRMSSLTMP